MGPSEFDVIKKYFTFADKREDVILAGGDDCAIVDIPTGSQLLVTTDTLISGVHFPEQTSAEDIAYKALMVNLSDLAAMGATPAWVTLAISLPVIDEVWISAFSAQLKTVLKDFNVSLIGGDITRGPLSITVQAMGLADKNQILRRDKAELDEKIFVTGFLGDAAIGLQAIEDELNDEKLSHCIERLNRPVAHIEFAEQLHRFSNCAIDVSDGLLADLGHILRASDCGAIIRLADIPISSSAKYYFEKYNDNIIDWSMLLSRGDDYEICFTAKKDDHHALTALAEQRGLKLSCIGATSASKGIICFDKNGRRLLFSKDGFKHF